MEASPIAVILSIVVVGLTIELTEYWEGKLLITVVVAQHAVA